jgi:hypothetical protein
MLFPSFRAEEKASVFFLEIRDLGLFLRLAELEADKKGGDNGGYNQNALEEIFHRSVPRSAWLFSFMRKKMSTQLIAREPLAKRTEGIPQ